MPSLGNLAPTSQVCIHTTAADFLEATEYILVEQERRSNLILAHALARSTWEGVHIGLGASAATVGRTPHERSKAWWARRWSGTQPGSEVGRDFWVTVWTVQTPVTSTSRAAAPNLGALRPPTLDLALAVFNSDPVFIFTPHSPMTLTRNFLDPRVAPLVQQLAKCMPVARMSRIFALFPIAESMAEAWSAYTGAQRAPESQCNVFSTYCTVATFAGVKPLPEGHLIGLADARHKGHLSRIYYEFEKEMVHHPVSYEFARSRVDQMIQRSQLWIYEYPVLDTTSTRVEYYEVAAIAALTRHTPAVAALSTIYTVPRFRGHRFAERLVGRVCNDVFARNKSAVLFVPGGNTAASSLLGRIGFYGMGTRATALGEEAETWREIGFVGGMRVAGSW